MKKRELSAETVRSTWDYDPTIGRLTWRISRGPLKAGAVAGKNRARSGYRYVQFEKAEYLEHRIVWVWVHGVWPSMLDHINCDKTDNRIANLRVASFTENGCNRLRTKRNTTGYKGVTWNQRMKKYVARVSFSGVRYNLGYFDSPEVAFLAYSARSAELHGEFQNLGVSA